MSEEEKQFVHTFKNLTEADRRSILELLREIVQCQSRVDDSQAIADEKE